MCPKVAEIQHRATPTTRDRIYPNIKETTTTTMSTVKRWLRRNSLIAFIVIIVGMASVTTIMTLDHGRVIDKTNGNDTNTTIATKSMPQAHRQDTASVALMANEIVISAQSAFTSKTTSMTMFQTAPAPAPTAVNTNSLQANEDLVLEQPQYQIQVDEDDDVSEMALKPQHLSTRNRINASSAEGNTTIANSKNNVVNREDQSNNNIGAGYFVASVDVRNGFHDKINISNQRNEFNAALNTSPASPAAPPSPLSVPNDDHVAASNDLVRELLQPKTPPAGSWKVANRVPQLRPHHRQKRYLLFPEGSSFQLVFDLIIPIVDYTNFAIMGITCAVAWELPSKPPSEIIANFREKLNDGTFGLSRRNDSAANDRIKYVDNAARGEVAADDTTERFLRVDDAGGDGGGNGYYFDRQGGVGVSVGVGGNSKSQAEMSATVAGSAAAALAPDVATSDMLNYEYGNRIPLATLPLPSPPTPSPINANFYVRNDDGAGKPSVAAFQPRDDINPYRDQTPAAAAVYYPLPHAQHPYKHNFDGLNEDDNKRWKSFQPSAMGYSAVRSDSSNRGGAGVGVSADVNDDNAVGGDVNGNNGGQYATRRTHTKPNTKYYKNIYGVGGTSGYASADKQKFADWQHQPLPWQKQPGTTTKYTYEYEGKNKFYQKDWRTATDKEEGAGGGGGGGGFNSDVYGPQVASGNNDWNAAANWQQDNWWTRNKGRVQDNWREKQRAWANIATPAGSQSGGNSAARTGGARKMLKTPLPHRVYPIFGKRRRRRQQHRRSLNPFEWKLEQIHLREHLQTRQRLYGKIEKLYKVRGHNGTACLLRALCETGRQQQQQQQEHHKQQHQTKPESFMMELLRAIFTLPQDMHAAPAQQIDARMDERRPTEQKDEQEGRHHIGTHYVEAYAYTGNCARRYALCEHSIWRDFQYEY